jgi:hypothetical protein
MVARQNLQLSVEATSRAAGRLDDPLIGAIASHALNERSAARNIALRFRADPAGVHRVVQKLMEDPALQVEALVRALGPAEVNAKGNELCGQMGPYWENISSTRARAQKQHSWSSRPFSNRGTGLSGPTTRIA